MSNYIEEAEGRKYEEHEDGKTGTRIFMYESGALEDLPKIGDKWPSGSDSEDPEGLTVVRRIKTPVNKDKRRPRWQIDYETRASENIIVVGASAADKLPRRGEVAGGFFSFTPPSGTMYFSNGSAVEQQVMKREAVGSFSIQKKTTKYDEMMVKVLAKVGRVNSSSFFGFDKGVVLYMGVQFDEIFNQAGTRTWLFTHNFSFRVVTFASGNDVDGWNFIYNPAAKEYQKVYENAGATGNSLYAYEDMAPLLVV